MTTYVYRPNHPEADEFGHVEKSKALEWDYQNSIDNRSDLASNHVISDEMPETRHMCDGKYYTSKAAFRRTTRAYGCTEFGNETKQLLTPKAPIQLDRRERREAIRKTIYDLKNGRRS